VRDFAGEHEADVLAELPDFIQGCAENGQKPKFREPNPPLDLPKQIFILLSSKFKD